MEVLPPENDLLMSSWAKSFVSLIWKSFSVAILFPEYNYKEQLQTLIHKTAPDEATLGSQPRKESEGAQSQSPQETHGPVHMQQAHSFLGHTFLKQLR